ncbi:MAG: hypothetical protein ACI9W4_002549 [Rhodothermales bacterium]|jgi:hypothetical protein
MDVMSKMEYLRVRQLDETLAAFKALWPIPPLLTDG